MDLTQPGITDPTQLTGLQYSIKKSLKETLEDELKRSEERVGDIKRVLELLKKNPETLEILQILNKTR